MFLLNVTALSDRSSVILLAKMHSEKSDVNSRFDSQQITCWCLFSRLKSAELLPRNHNTLIERARCITNDFTQSLSAVNEITLAAERCGR